MIRESFNGHGTTGTGFGETVYYGIEHDALRVGKLRNTCAVIKSLIDMRDFYIEVGFLSRKTSIL